MPLLALPNVLLILAIILFLAILISLFQKKIGVFFKFIVYQLRMRLGKLTGQLATGFQRTERKLTKELPRDGDDLFEELTPQDNADADKAYDKQLKWALENNNVRNIAITGPYGSGKSSIVKTFQKEHREYKYLNLSLANFQKEEVEGPGEVTNGNGQKPNGTKRDEKNQINEQLIEFSILQQIILHTRHSKLPGSRFHRIRHQSKAKTIWQTLLLSTFIVAIINVFFKDLFEKLKTLLSWQSGEGAGYNVLPWIFLLGFISLLYALLRSLANTSISKIKITEAEVELAKKDVSILNKHVEEILYFFEVTNYEIVVIEDLDRFENPGIFTKLREINQLINNAEQIKYKVVFLYVLGDHMFRGEERTKFFDFIVPVIPVVNSSNSYQLLSDRVKKAGLTTTLTDEFITEISLYINDMRLIKNIMNEFNLYYSKLKKYKNAALSDIHLFSMVLYKNKYPDDFAKMHMGEGMVVAAFNEKEKLIEKRVNELMSETKEIEKQILFIDSLVPKSVEELRMIYLVSWLGMMPKQPAVGFVMQGDFYFINQLLKDDVFANLINTGPGYFVRQYSSSLTSADATIKFKDAENRIDPVNSYETKELAIRKKAETDVKKLKARIESNKTEILKLKSALLAKILDAVPGFEFKGDIKDQRLLTSLLRNGYINEDYPYYISYFYEGSLLSSEQEFILSVKDGKAKPYNYELHNIPAILRKLRLRDFENPAILNIQLVDHLVTFSSLRTNELEAVMQTLGSGGQTTVDFTDQFLNSGKAIWLYVAHLAPYWKEWWNVLEDSATATDDSKEETYALLIRHAHVIDLVAMNEKGYVSNYLSVLRDFDVSEQKLKHLLFELAVKVETVKDEKAVTDGVLDHLHAHNLYAINPEMVNLIVTRKSNDPEIATKLATMHFTAVQESELKELNAHLRENIDEYLENVYLQLPENTKDPELTVLDMITNINVSKENVQSVITQVDAKFASLKELEEELWNFVLEQDKVLATWNTLSEYAEKFEVTESLGQFINKKENAISLARQKIGTAEAAVNFSKKLVVSPFINGNTLSVIKQGLPFPFELLSLAELAENRIVELVLNSMIVFNNESFVSIKKESRKAAMLFVEKNLDNFLANSNDYELDSEDYLALIKSEQISDSHKEEVVLLIGQTDFENAQLATSVAKFIRDRNIDIPFATLLSILQYSGSEASNVMIAIRYMRVANLKQDSMGIVDQLLAVLGENYTDIRIRGKNPTIQNTTYNLELAGVLEDAKYISSHNRTDDGIRIYTFKPQN